MYISYNWLQDFISLPKGYNAEKLATALTTHTVEVEEWQSLEKKFANVVVGKALEVSKHPQADRLRLAKVDVGTEVLNIVCGAPNLEAGQLVPVALVGAELPVGLTIEAAEIRGEKSNGMICALDELGLGDDHDGIMILDKKAKIGQSFAKYLNLNDVIIEIDNKSLSNRPDLWGHYGMAREISAFLKIKLRPYADFLDTKKWPVASDGKVNVKVEDTKLCPYYSAIKLSNIEVKESPSWLKDRLLAVGAKPINNIVDATNYIMLELGQPLHAFEANSVDKVIVRKSKKGESLETLDKENRELPTDTLVIANSKDPIAIAGIIGGQVSGINSKTKEIIIESANFDPVAIRLSSQKLGLRTEASSRFEKSLDPNLCPLAMERAVETIIKLCPQAIVESGISETGSLEVKSEPISLDLEWLNIRMGKNLDKTLVKNILEGLGFDVEEKDNNIFSVIVPSWRATKDVSIPEDLLEEVARSIGYDNLEPVLPQVEMRAPIVSEEYKLEQRVKDILAKDNHLAEVHNYSFINEKQLEKLQIDHSSYLRLANPLHENHTLLRQSLAPNLLEDVKANQSRVDEISLFEIGNVYLNVSGDLYQDVSNKITLPHQEKRLAIVVAGENVDLLTRIKGIIENLLTQLLPDYQEIQYSSKETWPGWASPNKSARLEYSQEILGQVLTVKDSVAKQISLKKPTVVAEINLLTLFKLLQMNSVNKYRKSPKFPAVTRDIALVVDSKVTYKDLKQAILNFHEWVDSVELFDIYQGEKLGADKKSLAFHVTYRFYERTLTAVEVDEIEKDLLNHLQKVYQAQIRDF